MTHSLLQSNFFGIEVNLSPELTPRNPQSMDINISVERTKLRVIRSGLYKGFDGKWRIVRSRAFTPVSCLCICLHDSSVAWGKAWPPGCYKGTSARVEVRPARQGTGTNTQGDKTVPNFTSSEWAEGTQEQQMLQQQKKRAFREFVITEQKDVTVQS